MYFSNVLALESNKDTPTRSCGCQVCSSRPEVQRTCALPALALIHFADLVYSFSLHPILHDLGSLGPWLGTLDCRVASYFSFPIIRYIPALALLVLFSQDDEHSGP